MNFYDKVAIIKHELWGNDMKKFLTCLVMVAYVGGVNAMYCIVPLTQSQQQQYDSLVIRCEINKLRDCSLRLQEKIESDDMFLKVLNESVNYAEKASDFVETSRTEKTGNTDIIIVRAMLCREECSLLTCYADFLRQREIMTRIKKVADQSLVSRMIKIGLLPQE